MKTVLNLHANKGYTSNMSSCRALYSVDLDQSSLNWPTDQLNNLRQHVYSPVLSYLAVSELLWLHVPAPAFPVFSSVSSVPPDGLFLQSGNKSAVGEKPL